MSKTNWINRWRFWIAPKPSKPGVWRRKEGGFVVRGRATDPHTGKMKNVLAPFPGADAMAAFQWLQAELAKIRAGTVVTPPAKTRFATYAASLLDRKVATGKIKSAKTRAQWSSVIAKHLIPAFGAMYLDEIRRVHIEAWRTAFAAKLQQPGTAPPRRMRGKRARGTRYSPHTGNDVLSVLAVVMNAAVAEFELPRNPMAGVERFDTSTHATYTEEEPNALTVEEVPTFLAAMRERFPQFYAMTALGFATGLRPSSLRPLRRQGATPDVLWDQGVLLVRQSHTRRAEVMPTTKTGRHQRIALPPEVIAILQWHVETQLATPAMRASDLLFPSESGGFRGTETLQKPFREVAKAIQLAKHLTPRAMRRTFQDLCRAAEVKDVVTRAVSGHATEEMQRHYSTVSGVEMRESLARVITLAGLRAVPTANDGVQTPADGAAGAGGVKSGVKEPQNEEGRSASQG